MSTFETTLSVPPTPTSRQRRRRWPYVLVVLVVLLAGFLVIASRVSVSYYALVPGDAMPVSSLITLPKEKAHAIHGQVLLTDVGVDDVTLLQQILYNLNLDSNWDTSLVPSGELTYNLPVSEFNGEGTVDMQESELTAEAVALRQLGYPVPEKDIGVTVYVIDPGSPAWRALKVGDVITSFDGTPTPNPQALQDAVRAQKPGDVVTLQVGTIAQPTPGHAVTLRLSSTVENDVRVPFIGIGDPSVPLNGLGTQAVYQLPFNITINSDQIGGPSAGLAWTLGIIDSLSGGELTGGKSIAATGTIHPDGTVGDVGGVEQKTVAVERAGASVFFVPPQELATAKSKATPSLKVFAVSSVQQALTDLEKLGGKLGSAASGPPPGPDGHQVPYDWQDSPWT